MGIDLTISIINENNFENKTWLAYERLNFDRDYKIFGWLGFPNMEAKKKLDIKEVPYGTTVEWYDDDGIDKSNEDPYGERLQYCFVGDIKKLKLNKDEHSERNIAIIGFLKKLPELTIIVLRWH